MDKYDHLAKLELPPMSWAMLEPSRSAWELGSLIFAAPLLVTAPRGDGHSVLVLPGFAASDFATIVLRSWLTYLGYRSEGWTLGRNGGYKALGESEERLREVVVGIAHASDRPISLIGWSLGGVMARHMARDYPSMIGRVITLGAPFTGDPRASNLRQLYEWETGDRLDSLESRLAWEANRAPPPQQTTSIFSKSDGLVAWRNCLEVESDRVQNVEIVGSHLGLPHNPSALLAIAEHLARPIAAAAI